MASLADDIDIAAERGPFAGRESHLDAPFWPTPPPLIERMLDLAGVGPGDRLIDLGCGDGRIVVAAARRGAFAHGIDIDPARIAEAEAAARLAGVGDCVRFEQSDLFDVALGEFSVVSLYLLPVVNRWLEGKLRRELEEGARVIGHAFPMPNWAPVAQEEHEGRAIYLWAR
jgi:cyclopropane fatty-acyl-phospholipid synthase-like methyltransferase